MRDTLFLPRYPPTATDKTERITFRFVYLPLRMRSLFYGLDSLRARPLRIDCPMKNGLINKDIADVYARMFCAIPILI